MSRIFRMSSPDPLTRIEEIISSVVPDAFAFDLAEVEIDHDAILYILADIHTATDGRLGSSAQETYANLQIRLFGWISQLRPPLSGEYIDNALRVYVTPHIDWDTAYRAELAPRFTETAPLPEGHCHACRASEVLDAKECVVCRRPLDKRNPPS
jgi:hypothetical protein